MYYNYTCDACIDIPLPFSTWSQEYTYINKFFNFQMKMKNCPVSENKTEKISFNIFWKYVLIIIDLVEELYIFLVIMSFNFLFHQNNTSNNHHFITLKMNQNGNYKLIPWGEIGIKITLAEEVFKIQMTRKMPFYPEH